ncbi:MAG: DUF58 domain-containing protein [Spirochaetales bacterium]
MFAFLVVYTASVSLLLRLRVPDLVVEQVLPAAHSGEPTRLSWRSGLPVTPPLFVWSVSVVARHGAHRKAVGRFDLAAGACSWELLRGTYQTTARLELRDLWGLTLWRPRARFDLTIKVLPAKFASAVPLPTARPTDLTGPRQAVRRSGEAFDVRPYQPGDDLRRLHWPLWAHSGQTWLRIPDLTPPPTGLSVWLVDLSVPASTPDPEAVLDLRAGSLAFWLQPGEAWTLQVPALGLACSNPGELGNFLAALTPSQDAPDPGERWLGSLPPEVLVVTGEGSPGLEALRRLLEPRTRVRPVLVPLPSPIVLARPRWWERR